MSRYSAKPVRPRTSTFINSGGGRRRCECCARLLCDEGVFPSEEESVPVYGRAPGDEVQEGELSVPDEEARPSKQILRPLAPSQAEIDNHRIDHLPYRNWCPECVEGFGRERAHRSREDEEREIPLVACDYLYLTPRGIFARDELPEGERDNACRRNTTFGMCWGWSGTATGVWSRVGTARWPISSTR